MYTLNHLLKIWISSFWENSSGWNLSTYYILKASPVSTQLLFLTTPEASAVIPFSRWANSLRVRGLTQVPTKAESNIRPEYFWLPGWCHSKEGTDSPSKLLGKFWFIVDIWLYPGRGTAHFNLTFHWLSLLSSDICQKLNKQIRTGEEAWIPPFSFDRFRTGCLENCKLFGIGLRYYREGFRLYSLIGTPSSWSVFFLLILLSLLSSSLFWSIIQ